jgi:transcriptional regulator with XRE-family HTH domain
MIAANLGVNGNAPDAPRPSSGAAARAREVADLLRSRRARLAPDDVGLPSGARRRTPGLRREEVAQLAGISTTYYTFLEQGRPIRPSPAVLDALATALRLTPTERALVHDLVHPPAAHRPERPESLPDTVIALVDRLDPQPTYVSGRCWDVLAANRAARALWADWPSMPLPERNILWWTLLHPDARSVLVEWESEAAAQLARFRAAALRTPNDPDRRALVRRILAASPEAREWWPRHDLAPLRSGTKRIRHPELGEIEFRHTVLQVADDPDLKLVTFAAPPRDEARIADLLTGHRP